MPKRHIFQNALGACTRAHFWPSPTRPACCTMPVFIGIYDVLLTWLLPSFFYNLKNVFSPARETHLWQSWMKSKNWEPCFFTVFTVFFAHTHVRPPKAKKTRFLKTCLAPARELIFFPFPSRPASWKTHFLSVFAIFCELALYCLVCQFFPQIFFPIHRLSSNHPKNQPLHGPQTPQIHLPNLHFFVVFAVFYACQTFSPASLHTTSKMQHELV